MKKLTTMIALVLLVGTFSAQAQCCKKEKECLSSKTPLCEQQKADTEVKAYYFHATRRCATCNAVETGTQEALKNYYGDKVAFLSINREKEKDNLLVKKYKINGQTLLIVKGEQVVDLTSKAFLYARVKPNEFKKIVKSTIDPLL